jgi:spore maturation protein CgeB
MTGRLRICIFAHSWRSDWNHGNAHFLRGLASALVRDGHHVRCLEPGNSWSFRNLMSEGEHGRSAVGQFAALFPELDVRLYSEDVLAPLEQELLGADVVIIHEWNAPRVVDHILQLKAKLKFLALFHDTHHRAYTNPAELLQFDLSMFDGVLAFGEALRRIYRDAFGVSRVWTFHEAADIRHFHPVTAETTHDVIWVGNWGDDERRRELEEFLLRPITSARCRAIVHGVRYPGDVRRQLAMNGIHYGGYMPNLALSDLYGQSLLSLHIPRRFYSNGLSGIPTIRVFEALACGIPLICSPWSDTERMFRAGEDYLVVQDGNAMQQAVSWLVKDENARKQIALQGLETIRKQHTCEHRAEQLLSIVEELQR